MVLVTSKDNENWFAVSYSPHTVHFYSRAFTKQRQDRRLISTISILRLNWESIFSVKGWQAWKPRAQYSQTQQSEVVKRWRYWEEVVPHVRKQGYEGKIMSFSWAKCSITIQNIIAIYHISQPQGIHLLCTDVCEADDFDTSLGNVHSENEVICSYEAGSTTM